MWLILRIKGLEGEQNPHVPLKIGEDSFYLRKAECLLGYNTFYSHGGKFELIEKINHVLFNVMRRHFNISFNHPRLKLLGRKKF